MCQEKDQPPATHLRAPVIAQDFRRRIETEDTRPLRVLGSSAPAANVATGFELRDRTDLRPDGPQRS